MTNPTTQTLRNTLRFLGVADITSGLAFLAAGSWLGDQLGLASVLVQLTGAFLIAFGIGSLLWADHPNMARATIAVEAGSALSIVGLLVAGPTAAGVVIAVGLVAWCTGAAAVVNSLLHRLPQPDSEAWLSAT